MKKLFLVLSFLALTLGVVSCNGDAEVQGVTDTEILVGNTAAVTGAFAGVGVPFNDAIKAVFEKVNDAGGIDGRTIKFTSYNDEFDATKGVTFTETLVEQDKVFALVGHFGTPTVGATIDYIQDKGVPMVYAATGINALYFEKSEKNPVMAVQPIYLTDGRIMAARAVKEAIYGASENAAFPTDGKIAVLYTNDDVGSSIKAGVEAELDILKIKEANVSYISTSVATMAAGITDAKFFEADVVILAMNQAPFAAALDAMATQTFNVPVFTSYVNADPTYVNVEQNDATRPIYTNAWVDVFSTDGQAAVTEYIATINAASFLTAEQKTAYAGNSFAIAGYIAAKVFVEGLKRVETNEETLNWKNFIAAMEEGPIDIPMGGTVDFSGGKRWGIASMSLLKYQVNEVEGVNVGTFGKVREIETIEEIEAK